MDSPEGEPAQGTQSFDFGYEGLPRVMTRGSLDRGYEGQIPGYEDLGGNEGPRGRETRGLGVWKRGA